MTTLDTTNSGTFSANCYRRSAWSCEVRLVVSEQAVLQQAARDLDALLERIDLAASRFRDDSALQEANRRAGTPTFIPRLLSDLVGVALHAAVLTDGAVDPTVHAGLLEIGYDRDITEVRTSGDPAAFRQIPAPRAPVAIAHDWRSVSLNRDLGLLRMPADVALDLGATAKAHTADLAAHDLAERYRSAVLVEIGGDVAVAGDRSGGWVIGVSETGSETPQRIALQRGGVATSTTLRRRWMHDGEVVHHIIDPSTGRPAAGPWRTVSVCAESALSANTASTAALVKGESGLMWLCDNGFAARLVSLDGEVVTTPGWPAGALELAAS